MKDQDPNLEGMRAALSEALRKIPGARSALVFVARDLPSGEEISGLGLGEPLPIFFKIAETAMAVIKENEEGEFTAHQERIGDHLVDMLKKGSA